MIVSDKVNNEVSVRAWLGEGEEVPGRGRKCLGGGRCLLQLRHAASHKFILLYSNENSRIFPTLFYNAPQDVNL